MNQTMHVRHSRIILATQRLFFHRVKLRLSSLLKELFFGTITPGMEVNHTYLTDLS